MYVCVCVCVWVCIWSGLCLTLSLGAARLTERQQRSDSSSHTHWHQRPFWICQPFWLLWDFIFSFKMSSGQLAGWLNWSVSASLCFLIQIIKTVQQCNHVALCLASFSSNWPVLFYSCTTFSMFKQRCLCAYSIFKSLLLTAAIIL